MKTQKGLERSTSSYVEQCSDTFYYVLFVLLCFKSSFIICLKFRPSTAQSTSLLMAVPLRRLLDLFVRSLLQELP